MSGSNRQNHHYNIILKKLYQPGLKRQVPSFFTHYFFFEMFTTRFSSSDYTPSSYPLMMTKQNGVWYIFVK